MSLFLYLVVWSVIGLLFFILWVAGNSGWLHFDLVPRWKLWTVYILGGPIVWVLGVLSR